MGKCRVPARWFANKQLLLAPDVGPLARARLTHVKAARGVLALNALIYTVE
jgi:hypothetical protein